MIELTPPAFAPAIFPSLSGRAAIVTGGASGIGAAIVRRLAASGMQVGLIDRDAAAAERLLAGMDPAAADGGPLPIVELVDLSDLDRVGEAIERLALRLGRLDLLVNNAARDERHTLDELDPRLWRAMMADNLDHMPIAARAARPHLRAAGGGAIINMGSLTWRLGFAGLPAYATAKAAIEGLTNALARELGPERIRVTCIVPGFVRTERQVRRWLTPELEARIRDSQCLPDLIEASEVAEVVAFLASDSARSITATAIEITAGWR